jgi:hypothetical protein
LNALFGTVWFGESTSYCSPLLLISLPLQQPTQDFTADQDFCSKPRFLQQTKIFQVFKFSPPPPPPPPPPSPTDQRDWVTLKKNYVPQKKFYAKKLVLWVKYMIFFPIFHPIPMDGSKDMAKKLIFCWKLKNNGIFVQKYVAILLVSLEIEQLELFLVVQIDREIKEHILVLLNKKVLVSIFLFLGLIKKKYIIFDKKDSAILLVSLEIEKLH